MAADKEGALLEKVLAWERQGAGDVRRVAINMTQRRV